MRSGFRNIPESIIESAYIDGASEWRILFQIVVPLSKATFLVVGLFVAIAQWNSFVGPLILLNDPSLFPLTLLLRKVLIQGSFGDLTIPLSYQTANLTEGQIIKGTPGFILSLQMATTMIAIGPILLVYPFIQRYFTKGAMLGSVKE